MLVALALLAAGCEESRQQPRGGDDLIAFSRIEAYHGRGPTGIFVVRPDGTGERRVTPPGSWFRSPTWSPDGTRLAYVEGDSGLYAVTLDGRTRRPINRQTSQYSALTWAPDGRSLAVTVHLGPHNAPSTAAIVSAEGGPLRHLVVRDVPKESYDSIVYGLPVWSPDSRRLAYAQSPSHPWGGGPMSPERIAAAGIYTLGPDGGHRRRVTHSGRARDYVGHWLRNGRILFARREGLRITLYSVEEDGDDLTRIARLPDWRWSASVAVSPDERWVAWAAESGIYLTSPDGGPARLLTELQAYDLSWSPDNRSIAFTLRRPPGGISVLDLRDERATRITPAGEAPAWRPAP